MPALEMGGFTNDLEDLDSFFESVFCMYSLPSPLY